MSADIDIVLAAIQTQIDALTRAVRAQQDTIDALTDTVIAAQTRESAHPHGRH
jgi:hypothetical protein